MNDFIINLIKNAKSTYVFFIAWLVTETNGLAQKKKTCFLFPN